MEKRLKTEQLMRKTTVPTPLDRPETAGRDDSRGPRDRRDSDHRSQPYPARAGRGSHQGRRDDRRDDGRPDRRDDRYERSGYDRRR
ncbi:hypothetical protein HDV03_005487 [Kappamyces sp. JEL0829]|nr:hypothetical protein HDV03_005487 [Kappamyces sp. JEL0829]